MSRPTAHAATNKAGRRHLADGDGNPTRAHVSARNYTPARYCPSGVTHATTAIGLAASSTPCAAPAAAAPSLTELAAAALADLCPLVVVRVSQPTRGHRTAHVASERKVSSRHLPWLAFGQPVITCRRPSAVSAACAGLWPVGTLAGVVEAARPAVLPPTLSFVLPPTVCVLLAASHALLQSESEARRAHPHPSESAVRDGLQVPVLVELAARHAHPRESAAWHAPPLRLPTEPAAWHVLPLRPPTAMAAQRVPSRRPPTDLAAWRVPPLLPPTALAAQRVRPLRPPSGPAALRLLPLPLLDELAARRVLPSTVHWGDRPTWSACSHRQSIARLHRPLPLPWRRRWRVRPAGTGAPIWTPK